MKTAKWRFETGKIYKFSKDQNAYIFFGTYLQAGIKSSRTSEALKIKKAEELELWRFEQDLYN